ncbi:hypothetical protein [Prosthecobacter sp.]|uniref:hypothetical protein n=1 Tax=Prosthecobacter sp. TaxID=1965333 RepID=UPI00378376CC
MDFLDLFFPQQAQASHLRDLAEASQRQNAAFQRERFRQQRQQREEDSRVAEVEQRIAQLERDIGQAGLVIEALLELLEESQTLNRQLVAERTTAIDARDGTVDGRRTPPKKEPWSPRRKWPGPREG